MRAFLMPEFPMQACLMRACLMRELLMLGLMPGHLMLAMTAASMVVMLGDVFDPSPDPLPFGG